MFDALKTQDKFNPYLIILPCISALAAYQGGVIVGGAIKAAIEKIKNKKN